MGILNAINTMKAKCDAILQEQARQTHAPAVGQSRLVTERDTYHNESNELRIQKSIVE